MVKRIAFDLDETLGATISDGQSIVGFRIRDGAEELLTKLNNKYELVLWSVSGRRYLDKVLSYGLKNYFVKTYSWDEMPCKWKDIRKIKADYLIDDSPDHKEAASLHGIENSYIVIPAFGSPIDQGNALLWITQIESYLL